MIGRYALLTLGESLRELLLWAVDRLRRHLRHRQHLHLEALHQTGRAAQWEPQWISWKMVI